METLATAENPTLFRVALKCKEIQRALFHEYDVGQAIVCFNSTRVLLHEADVLVVRKSGVSLEFEVKVSYEDFRADFRKKDKHAQLARGEAAGPQYFYYACEPGVIPPEKVPAYAGLVHITRHYFPNRGNTWMDHKDKITVVKEAPRLHKAANEGIYFRLCRSLMYPAFYRQSGG